MEARARTLECYSKLGHVLASRKMTIADLQRALTRHGRRVNVKTLYRLANALEPLARIETSVLASVCDLLRVGVSDVLSFEPARPRVRFQRLGGTQAKRLAMLLSRQERKSLTDPERQELRSLIDRAEQMTLANAKALASARRVVR